MHSKIFNNKLLRNIYACLSKKYLTFLGKFFPTFASKRLYKKKFKKNLNMKNPQTFNEKLMFIKIKNYNNNELVFICSDKIKMRDYVMSKGIESKNLTNILKTYSSTEDINFDELPKKFVLKCSHGCGFNIVCQDKSQLNKKDTLKLLDRWKKTKFGYLTAEPHYTHVKPTIYCEEFIENENGEFPNDYKVYCFNGVPKIILTCTERNQNLKLNFFDLDWNELMIGTSEYRSRKKITKPSKLNDMIDISKKISCSFPFVRCDFYEYKGNAILGEMTFTPAGCIGSYYTLEGEDYLGSLLDINNLKRSDNK